MVVLTHETPRKLENCVPAGTAGTVTGVHVDPFQVSAKNWPFPPPIAWSPPPMQNVEVTQETLSKLAEPATAPL
jgi:hypothetical protein